MTDRHGNDWTPLGDPLKAERCPEPGCPSRRRRGSALCWDHHRGEPVWNERHELWQGPERLLYWCSLTDTRELVLL